jgi:DegV family protein with EDD domain
MKVAISVETAADLSKEIIQEFDIKVIPFTITLGDITGYDGDITTDQIIEFVNKTKKLPKTSAVNVEQFNEHFSSLLKNYDAVIHFSLSSQLSCACQNAKISAQNFNNVFVIDSQTLSTGIGLLAIYAVKLARQGLDAKTIYDKCVKRLPYVQASFELKRVDYLYKGGRCSVLSYLGANVFKIRPQIIVKDGKMISGKKYRGSYEHVVKNYCQDTLQMFDNPDLTRAFVTYTTADESVVNTAKEYLENAGFKEILVTRAGGTITSHCGENCLGILFMNDGEK